MAEQIEVEAGRPDGFSERKVFEEVDQPTVYKEYFSGTRKAVYGIRGEKGFIGQVFRLKGDGENTSYQQALEQYPNGRQAIIILESTQTDGSAAFDFVMFSKQFREIFEKLNKDATVPIESKWDSLFWKGVAFESMEKALEVIGSADSQVMFTKWGLRITSGQARKFVNAFK